MTHHHHHLLILAKIAIYAGAAIVAARTDHNPRVQIDLHHTTQRSPVHPLAR